MWCCTLLAQVWLSNSATFDYGARAGLSYQVGTQGNRVGVNVGVFGRSDRTHTEAFVSWSGYRNFSHMETSQPGWESQWVLGVTQGFGGKRSAQPDSYDWSLAANNTRRKNSVSLYTTRYHDTYGTSQRVLGVGLNLNRWNLRFEDDFDPSRLLGDYGDRYRTGALEVGYRVTPTTWVVGGFNTFTGDPEQGGVRTPQEGASGRYGDYSMQKPDGRPVDAHDRSIGNAYVGIRGFPLSTTDDSVSSVLGLDNLQLRVGWSSEEIRDVTQNYFHDLIANPRIPLRNVPGKPYVEFGTNQGQTLYP